MKAFVQELLTFSPLGGGALVVYLAAKSKMNGYGP